MDLVLLLDSLPLSANLFLFVVAGIATWFAGSKLSTYGVVIADRINFAHSLMGFLIIAAATSLPELVITLTGAIKSDIELVLNNMFGGISMQTAIIALADMVAITAPITFLAFHSSLLLEASLLILILSVTLAIIFIKGFNVIAGIGVGAIIVSLLYLLCIHLLNQYEHDKQWTPIERPDKEKAKIAIIPGLLQNRKRPLKTLIYLFLLDVVIVFCSSFLLANIAMVIATKTGLGSSFIGATLLAATTSLPEISATITAVSMGAYSMAISNIFGSNMLMIALILPAEIFYRGGAILQEAGQSATFAIISGILLTAIYLAGLIIRNKKTFLNMGIDSILVIVFYFITLVAFYHLR